MIIDMSLVDIDSCMEAWSACTSSEMCIGRTGHVMESKRGENKINRTWVKKETEFTWCMFLVATVCSDRLDPEVDALLLA